MIRHGTGPTKKDRRDFSFHRTFGATLDFPENYNVDLGITVPDQNADGLPMGCTGYTTAEIGQDEDGQLYEPRFSYEKTCQMEGHDTTQGCQIRTALKSSIVYGLKKHDETDQQALEHRRGAYFNVEPVGDYFDGIRSAMWLARDEKRAVSIGTPWIPSFGRPLPGGFAIIIGNNDPMNLPWHNWKICGWKTINGQPYLIGKTWQGKDYGDNGYAYFSRGTINQLMDIWGTAAFTVRAFKPEDVKTVKLSIYETIAYFLRRLVELVTASKIAPAPQNAPATPPTPAIPPSSRFHWESPTAARLSVRQICDEEGLTVTQKNILTACVHQESQFNPRAIGPTNTNGTTDYGLCQYNTGKNPKTGKFYWIGPGAAFADIQEVLDNPEKNVRVMARFYKTTGHLKPWASFTSGAYKKYL